MLLTTWRVLRFGIYEFNMYVNERIEVKVNECLSNLHRNVRLMRNESGLLKFQMSDVVLKRRKEGVR
jgi:hypothetical protein